MIQSFILGIVEGVTEFLPISSTAHLILTSYLLKINQNNFHKFFEVFIQTGAICAVVFNYFYFLKQKKELIKKIIVSFIPTAAVGFILYKIIKNLFFENYILISLSFIILGIVFIVIEKLIQKQKIKLEFDLSQLDYKKSFLIGIFQGFAVIPGVSRAGAVILGMLFLKFKREESVLYSFFIAVPTIISAGLYDLYKTEFNQIPNHDWLNLIIGFITSFIFALITIKWFIKYLQKNNLISFGWYRIIIGLIFLFLIF